MTITPFCLLTICAKRVKQSLEPSREHIAKFIVGQTLHARYDERMCPSDRADDDPGDLADANGAFNRRNRLCHREIGGYTSSERNERALDACR